MEELNLNQRGQIENEFYEDVPELGLLKRIAGVFISPVKVMKSLAAKPKVLFPLIAIPVIPIISILLRYSDYKEYMIIALEKQLENMNVNLTPEMIDMQINIGVISGIASIPITLLVSLFIGTLILWGISKMFGGKGKYKQYLSVTSHAGLIAVCTYILMLVLSLITGEFDITNVVTSLSSVLPEDLKGSSIYGFASTVELFTIWQYVVIGIGVAEVGRLSKAKAFSIVGGIYLVSALVTGLFASISL